MGELEKLGEEVRAELGVPSASWLRAQKQRVLRTAPPSRGEPRRLVWLAAAALVLSAGLALALFVNFGAERARPASVALSAGAETHRVRLDDGSSVALNPGARALVENAPALTRFDLQRGYVEFEVAHQGSRRFVVLAGAVEVTVVGTRFSVLHDASGAVEVQVTHGIVSVRSPDRGAPLLLKAGERFRGGAVAAASAAPPREAAASLEAVAPTAATEPSVEPPSGTPAASAPASSDWEAAYRERRYALATARAKELGVERLLGSLSAQKLAELGDAARLGGDADLALRTLDALKRRFPNSSEAADADFLGGKLLATRGQSQRAIERFEQYLKRGERAYTTEAMGRLVELYSSNGDSSRARAMAERYLERSPHGPYRRLCVSTLEKR